jgi:hypothetical protein
MATREEPSYSGLVLRLAWRNTWSFFTKESNATGLTSSSEVAIKCD